MVSFLKNLLIDNVNRKLKLKNKYDLNGLNIALCNMYDNSEHDFLINIHIIIELSSNSSLT